MTLILVLLIVVALFFDFLNGLHDAANSIATIVSTRVLAPRYAVAWAAFFNFIAFAVFGLHVAATIGTGIVAPSIISDQVIFGALMGAITWNIVTWLAGIPSSSSHALIGGLVGAGVAKGGWHIVVWAGLGKTVAAIGLRDLIVVQTDEAVLVLPKSRAQDVKMIVERLKARAERAGEAK